MASIIKHGFRFVLVGLTFASIASAEVGPATSPHSGASGPFAADGAIPPIGSQSQIGNRKSAIPLRVPFIQNQGQIADPHVLFYARTFGGTVYVTAEGQLVYVLPRSEDSPQSKIENRKSKIPHLAVIRETLVDADLMALPSGAERSGAIINSFIGNDPRRWQANIPSFTGVQFGDIYEGIALEVRATGDNVEKIFTVAPGADPARIALRLAGTEGVSITPSGELEARTALGPVRFTAPVAYQRNAAGERQSVSVAYALEGDQVGFCVGAFDAARPLVIDPLLASTFIGGSSSNVIRAMALDSQTNVLVAGYTASTDFPTTNSYDTNYHGGSYDGFIAKFDPYLTNLLAATYLGGASNDAIMAMGINSNNGAVYVAGYTASTDFPITNAAYSNYNGGDYDAFVSVLNSNLMTLTASTYLGGTNVDMAYAVALNAAADVYVAGYTASTNFPTNNIYGATFQTNLAGANDAFVAKFNAALSANQASTFVGGNSSDQAFSMAIDTNDFVYLAGITASTNFPVTNGYQMARSGASDAFVAKLSGALTNMVASTYLGGTGNEAANGIAVAPFTNIVCVVGYTESVNFPTTAGSQTTIGGLKDAFLTRLNLALTNVLASTYLGGTGDDEATAVLTSATTNSLRIYVAGHTTSSNFPVTTNAYDTSANGGRDAFVSYFGTGATLQASTYLGGATNDSAYAMALQADRFSLFVAGATASTNFPATLRAYDNDRTGRTNDYGFVTKLGFGLAYGTKKWQVTISDPGDLPLGSAWFGSPSLGWDGTIYVGGGSNLYAYDANGNERWHFRAKGHITDNGGYDGLGSTPAIARDGTIYFGTLNGYLHAVSKDGVGLRTNFFSGQKIYSSPAIGNDDTIYFGATESPWPFYAVSSNGTVRWTTNMASSIIGSPAIDTNGRIYVACSVGLSDAQLYMIDTNGTAQTNWSLSGVGTPSSPMIASNGWVYIGSGAKLYGFDTASSASQTWATAGTIYSSPAMDSNGVIYVGGGANLYAFNTNGNTNHTWTTGGAIESSPAIAEDGTIYVADIAYLYAFNSDGSTNWVSVETDADVEFQSPLLRRDGTIYFTDNLNLYAVCGKSQISQSSWPTYKHDVLRTGNAAFDAAEILTPTNLTASQGAYSNYVDVNWNGDPNADYYEVFRGTNDVDTPSLFQTLLTTNCVDTNVAPGQIYYYWVRVATPVAMSDFSASASGGVPPLPPTGVTASKGEPPHTNEIAITWNASSNATTYSLYHSLTNATNTADLLTTTNVTGYTNSPPSITRGLTYYYWVQAGNGAAGTSGFSADYGVTNSGGTPPLAPTNITASTNDYRWVYVEWSASTGATMYAVYRNTSNNIPAAFMAVTNGLTFADTTAESLKDYYYWVRSTNAYGMGEFSASTNGWRLLVPPTNVRADGTFTNKIRVSWQVEPAATSYIVYRNSTNYSATASNIAATATNYVDDLFVERGVGYYYWVRSKNAYGISVFSQVAEGGTMPRAPLYVNATDGTDNNPVTVTWDSAVYATGYEVFRQSSYAPWSLTEPLGSADGTIYSDTAASPGLRYYYWVKATNQFGRSELSGFDTGYRPLAPPYAISASDGVSADHLYVNWSKSKNASSYELWRGTNSDRAAALVLVNAVTTNAYDDADSVQGVLYYYWVKAKTTQFVSDFSSYDSGYRALRQVDIGVSDLVFLPTRMAVVGAPAAASFRVTNYGVQNMAAPNAEVAYNFYISSNSVFGDADDKWMGGTNVSIPLVVGNSAVVVLPKAGRNSLAVPTVVPGWYYIFVNIQHAAPTKWLDPNLVNNTISRNGGVIQIGASQPAGLLLVNDYNGDGYTDLAMYQESTGTWAVWFFGAQGFTMAGYGGVGFKAVPSDYDGDGKTDLAVYKEATGTWEVWLSAGDYAMASIDGWGGPGFEPVPSDYDGDGLADPAVYQASTGTWRVWLSGTSYTMEQALRLQPSGSGIQPVPGDYDGDGKADPAVYQEQGGAWQIWRSSWKYASVTAEGWGGSGYRPVVADYDLDGIMDPAVFQASTGSWKVWLSASGYAEESAQGWGSTGTMAVTGDYDGDGLADPAVYWDSFGMWRLWLSGSGYQKTELLVWPGDGYRAVWP
ncbi:MAG: PQQ-binding-like beta-propeller repeat protein [Kiritimatiellae bacterium]|nr:PQQ-binding-like beta-propeller repeat protein [Kiritimatiellia bacterium]